MLMELITGKWNPATATSATLATLGNGSGRTVATVATVAVATSQKQEAEPAYLLSKEVQEKRIEAETGQGATMTDRPGGNDLPEPRACPGVAGAVDVLTAGYIRSTLAGIWRFCGTTMSADRVVELEAILDDLDGGVDPAVIGRRLVCVFARVESEVRTADDRNDKSTGHGNRH